LYSCILPEICHPERSEPESEANRLAQSKDPYLVLCR